MLIGSQGIISFNLIQDDHCFRRKKIMTTKPKCLIDDDEPSYTTFIANALEKNGDFYGAIR